VPEIPAGAGSGDRVGVDETMTEGMSRPGTSTIVASSSAMVAAFSARARKSISGCAYLSEDATQAPSLSQAEFF